MNRHYVGGASRLRIPQGRRDLRNDDFTRWFATGRSLPRDKMFMRGCTHKSSNRFMAAGAKKKKSPDPKIGA
ncbi:MAG: hypothetical protein KKG47_08000 [Proteobacteria bacterium]|nr:hypothetical protein [Pseudomonadota bacterium]MBU1738241.1 hypothetical protein [Pseudomonadota bacterium]